VSRLRCSSRKIEAALPAAWTPAKKELSGRRRVGQFRQRLGVAGGGPPGKLKVVKTPDAEDRRSRKGVKPLLNPRCLGTCPTILDYQNKRARTYVNARCSTS